MTNKVFFLGKGFSVSLIKSCTTNKITYPTLEELTENILKDFNIALQNHLNGISPNYKNDIELLLTYLSTDLPWQNPQVTRLDRTLYYEIISRISKYFNKLEQSCIFDFKKFEKLANFIIGNKTPIITLNYDTMLEKLLFSSMPEEYQRTNTYKEFYKQAIIDLRSRRPHSSSGFAKVYRDENSIIMPDIYKLHGSVNWLWSATNPSNPIYYATGKELTSLTLGLSEYIIPPILDKTKFYNHTVLKSIWSEAYEALKNADEICIIGFSFPKSDLSIEFLFHSAFSDRRNYPKIYAVNTKESIDPSSKNYIKNRYDSVFWDWNVDYTYCCDDSLNKFIQEKL